MKTHIPEYFLILKDYEIIEPRFEFPGFSNTGFCFLKISIKQGCPVFFCIQLKGYSGTSITNAVEDIFKRAISRLVEKEITTSTRKKSLSDYFFKEKFEQKKHSDLVRFFSEKSLWIEHYPPEVGIITDGSFSIVKFDTHLHPSWSHVPKDKVVQISGLDKSFFNISDSNIHYDQQQ